MRLAPQVNSLLNGCKDNGQGLPVKQERGRGEGGRVGERGRGREVGRKGEGKRKREGEGETETERERERERERMRLPLKKKFLRFLCSLVPSQIEWSNICTKSVAFHFNPHAVKRETNCSDGERGSAGSISING